MFRKHLEKFILYIVCEIVRWICGAQLDRLRRYLVFKTYKDGFIQ
jgi:hypothetical protein